MEHTKACIKRRESRLRAIEKWRQRWPNHCPHCQGDTNCGAPCDWCLMQLKCPRCGEEDAMHPEDANVPCKFCGWSEVELKPGMACPEEPDCNCRVAKAKERERELARLQREILDLENQVSKMRRSR